MNTIEDPTVSAHEIVSTMLLEMGAPVCTAMMADIVPMSEMVADAIHDDLARYAEADETCLLVIDRMTSDLVNGRFDRVLMFAGCEGCVDCCVAVMAANDAGAHCADCGGSVVSDWLLSEAPLSLLDATDDAESRAQSAAQECVTLRADMHRVTMERDGARHLADEAQRARAKQSLELAEVRAEVVRLRAALGRVAPVRTATFLKGDDTPRLTPTGWAQGKLYRVSEPVEYSDGEKTRTTDHIVVSRARINGDLETYIFPADASGEVLDWNELPGSRKGDITHESLLRASGYEVVS